MVLFLLWIWASQQKWQHRAPYSSCQDLALNSCCKVGTGGSAWDKLKASSGHGHGHRVDRGILSRYNIITEIAFSIEALCTGHASLKCDALLCAGAPCTTKAPCCVLASSDGKLRSLDHADFILCRQQQLISPAYTLAGFQQYLVLQLDTSGAHTAVCTKVLVPFGRVCCNRPASAASAALEGRGQAGRVRVEVPACCAAKIEVGLHRGPYVPS